MTNGHESRLKPIAKTVEPGNLATYSVQITGNISSDMDVRVAKTKVTTGDRTTYISVLDYY